MFYQAFQLRTIVSDRVNQWQFDVQVGGDDDFEFGIHQRVCRSTFGTDQQRVTRFAAACEEIPVV